MENAGPSHDSLRDWIALGAILLVEASLFRLAEADDWRIIVFFGIVAACTTVSFRALLSACDRLSQWWARLLVSELLGVLTCIASIALFVVFLMLESGLLGEHGRELLPFLVVAPLLGALILLPLCLGIGLLAFLLILWLRPLPRSLPPDRPM